MEILNLIITEIKSVKTMKISNLCWQMRQFVIRGVNRFQIRTGGWKFAVQRGEFVRTNDQPFEIVQIPASNTRIRALM